ncbi:MAG TPA: penicillin acylase family protein, partial [Bacteriovoracaceae bacterium]|nr:penicillin acylase family protein [Bacteriovoracaceae bacterium]
MDEWEVNESALYLLLDNLDKTRATQLRPLYEKAQKEVSQRKWGELSKLPFEHLSGNKKFQFSPVLSSLGDEHTVGPGTTRWKEDEKQYEHFSGASMRMIVEMSNPVKVFINLPGKNRDYQKGSLEGPWQDWRMCKYFEVSY